MNLREIDRLLGEHYMGYRYSEDGSRYEDVEEGEQRWYDAAFWRPTEEMSDAWLVVDRLRDAYDVDLSCDSKLVVDPVVVCALTPMVHDHGTGVVRQYEETAELAICLAALKAKGLEVPE